MSQVEQRIARLEQAVGMNVKGPSRYELVFWNDNGTSTPGGDTLMKLLEENVSGRIGIINIRYIGGLK